MRWVVITGSEGGIGRALSEAFLETGFGVIGIDVALGSSNARVRHINADLLQFCKDPTNRKHVIDVIRDTVKDDELGVLVNNAATQRLKPTAQISDDDWFDTMHANLNAPFLLVRELLPLLISAKGCVINIASIHANLTKPGFVAYATSKAALVGMTRAMAVDVGNFVRVNAICPAAINTPMLVDGFKDDLAALEKLNNFHPVGSIGLTQEVAEVALLMASGKVPFMNGAAFGLDGGIGSRLHDPN